MPVFSGGMQDYFGTTRGVVKGSVPQDATRLGFIIQDSISEFASGSRRGSNGSLIRDVNFSRSELRIPFQYIEKVPVWIKTANYQDLNDIIGRFESISVYQNSNAQDISLTLIYHAEGARELGHSTSWTIEFIEEQTKKIQSLQFPRYDGTFGPPPKVLLNIGNLYNMVPVTVRNITMDYEGPYQIESMATHVRKITIELKTAYPLWQAIGHEAVHRGQDDNRVFAYQNLRTT